MSGLVHIYCGNGKGKTTAAIGLAIRAAGSGMNVLFARFLKNNDSSELVVLNSIERFEFLPITKNFGFYKNMTDEEKTDALKVYSSMLDTAIEKVSSGNYQMLVLDEIFAAYHYDLIDSQVLIEFIEHKPEDLEIVMTGRDPPIKLIALADYVSNIESIKHPYDEGIPARIGIEK